MKKVMLIYGTRPEAIKMAPIVLELKKQNNIRTLICLTGQHREMVDEIHKNFSIVADYDLNIMQPNQSLSDITEKLLQDLKSIFKKENPDLVVVQGDTTSAFAAALAAFYEKIKIAHVEAGLRTHNKYSPFPEEINRKLISSLADIHFAPTEQSKQNLLKENVSNSQIHVTGNTAIDALLSVKEKLQDQKFLSRVKDQLQGFGYKLRDREIVLITNHRRENFGEPMKNIFEAIKELATEFKNLDFVFPVHLNPEVQKQAKSVLSGVDNIFLIRPLDYFSFSYLMIAAKLIITDSGGIQEEATGLATPIIITRNETERPEVLQTGRAYLVGSDNKKLVAKAIEILKNSHLKEEQVVWPFGKGEASIQITDYILGVL